MELFDCKPQENGTHTLTVYPAIDCYSQEWNELLPFAVGRWETVELSCVTDWHQVFGLLVYGVGVPIWMSLVLRYYIKAHHRGTYRRTFTFWHNFPYHASFRHTLYWWGLVLLVRKLLISIAVVSITSDEGSKILVAFLVLFLSLYLQVHLVSAGVLILRC